MASKYYDSTGKSVVNGDTAVASDLNDINTAIDAGLQIVEADIGTVVAESAAWADKAKSWAEEPYGVEVEVGKYSALHHETNAATSAGNALTSANNASSSASSASTSASSALASKNAAATSATNASTSASAAATSETNAASSASAAATSETNAASSASAAATSATNAASSATAAATSETNAASSATSAASSAAAAATSATNAASSASSASISATNAATSETNAASSASAAAISESNAEDAAAAAASTSASLAEDTSTTAGLTWGWLTGQVRSDNIITDVAADTLLLTDNATNYVEYTVATGMTVNQVGFTSGAIPIRTVITLTGVQTSSVDERAWLVQDTIQDTIADPFIFNWEDKSQAPFYRSAPNILKTRELIFASVNGVAYQIPAETLITMPTVTAGEDYAIWLKPDGSLESTANFVTPPIANSRFVGQWHSLCASVGTITGHPLSGFLAGDILPLSIQSLGFRPSCADKRGMVYNPGTRGWVDIYLASIDAGELATLSGAAFVTGATTEAFHAYKFDQWLGRIGKRTMTSLEFVSMSIGSNQGTNITGSTNPITTGGHVDTAGRRMISDIGCEDCCGVLWQWGQGNGSEGGTAAWANAYDVNDTGVAGQHYSVPNRPLCGGAWSAGVICGSRGSSWAISPLSLSSDSGVRGLAEPE